MNTSVTSFYVGVDDVSINPTIARGKGINNDAIITGALATA